MRIRIALSQLCELMPRFHFVLRAPFRKQSIIPTIQLRRYTLDKSSVASHPHSAEQVQNQQNDQDQPDNPYPDERLGGQALPTPYAGYLVQVSNHSNDFFKLSAYPISP